MAMKVFCKHCGKGNAAGTEKCTDCGNKLPTGKTKILKKEDLPDIPSLRDKITKGPVGMWNGEGAPPAPAPPAFDPIAPAESGGSPLPPSPRFVKCPSCGHRNRMTSRFCNECGAKLEGARRDSGPVTVVRDVPDWMTLPNEDNPAPPAPDPASLPPIDEIRPKMPPPVADSPPPPDPASLPPLVPDVSPEPESREPVPDSPPPAEPAPAAASGSVPQDTKDYRIVPLPRRGPGEQDHREQAVFCTECNTLNVRYSHCVDCGAVLSK